MRAGVTSGRAGALAAAAALVGTLLVGCGGGGGLDVAAVQRAITRRASVAYPMLGVASTRCPDATQDRLRCTVRTAGLPLHVTVRTTRSGRLGLTALDAVIPNAAAAYLVHANASIPALVGCGPSGVTVAAPGATLPAPALQPSSLPARPLDPSALPVGAPIGPP